MLGIKDTAINKVDAISILTEVTVSGKLDKQ
jgi:hypothetical protein